MSALESDTELRLEVGKTYRDRAGNSHRINRSDGDEPYPFESDKHSWTPRGRYLDFKKSNLDLIGEVKPSIDGASPEEWNELSSSEAIRQLLDEASQNPPTPTPFSTQIGGNHYKDFPIQPIEFITKNELGFCEGNVVKYVCRYKAKGGLEDLEKAKHYLELLMSQLGEVA